MSIFGACDCCRVCFFQHIWNQCLVSHSFLVWLGSFSHKWESTLLANHRVSVWYYLELLLCINMVSPSVFIYFAWSNLQMKSILLVYQFRIFTSIWHCLLIDQKDYYTAICTKHAWSMKFTRISYIFGMLWWCERGVVGSLTLGFGHCDFTRHGWHTLSDCSVHVFDSSALRGYKCVLVLFNLLVRTMYHMLPQRLSMA